MARTLAFSGGTTYTFLTVLSNEGIPLLGRRHVEEALDAMGVYGRRWRKVSEALPQIELHTLAEAATFAAAKTAAEAYIASVVSGQLATLTIDSYSYTVHVSAVAPVPRPGTPIGAGAGGGVAHVIATWALEIAAP